MAANKSFEELLAECNLGPDEKQKLLEFKREEEAELEAKRKIRSRKIQAGTFFSTIDDVWEVDLEAKREPASMQVAGSYDRIFRSEQLWQRRNTDNTFEDNVFHQHYGTIVETMFNTSMLGAQSSRGLASCKKDLQLKPNFDFKRKKTPGVSPSGGSQSDTSQSASSTQHSDASRSRRKKNKGKKSASSVAMITTPQRVEDTSRDGSAAESVASGVSSNLSKGQQTRDIFGKAPSSKGHLLADNPNCLTAQAIIGPPLLGLKIDSLAGVQKEEKVQMMLQLAMGRGYTDDSEVVPGIVDSDPNIIWLPSSHGPYFDANPCWMFIPILSLREVLEWPTKPKSEKSYWVMAISAELGEYLTRETVQSAMCVYDYNPETSDNDGLPLRQRCDESDFNVATDLLDMFVRALADSHLRTGDVTTPTDLYTCKPPSGGLRSTKKKKSAYDEHNESTELKLIRATVRDLMENGISLPVRTKTHAKDLEVMKVFINSETEGANVPDPMLVISKTVLNWSSRCGQKLLSGCPQRTSTPPWPGIGFVTITPDKADDESVWSDLSD